MLSKLKSSIDIIGLVGKSASNYLYFIKNIIRKRKDTKQNLFQQVKITSITI